MYKSYSVPVRILALLCALLFFGASFLVFFRVSPAVYADVENSAYEPGWTAPPDTVITIPDNYVSSRTVTFPTITFNTSVYPHAYGSYQNRTLHGAASISFNFYYDLYYDDENGWYNYYVPGFNLNGIYPINRYLNNGIRSASLFYPDSSIDGLWTNTTASSIPFFSSAYNYSRPFYSVVPYLTNSFGQIAFTITSSFNPFYDGQLPDPYVFSPTRCVVTQSFTTFDFVYNPYPDSSTTSFSASSMNFYSQLALSVSFNMYVYNTDWNKEISFAVLTLYFPVYDNSLPISNYDILFPGYTSYLTALVGTDSFSSGYNSGYTAGESAGEQTGYNKGYSAGNTAGYNNGYSAGHAAGIASANDYSFIGLIGAVIDAPINAFTSLFDFDVLGINLSSFFLSLLTVCIVLKILSLIGVG